MISCFCLVHHDMFMYCLDSRCDSLLLWLVDLLPLWLNSHIIDNMITYKNETTFSS